MQDPDPKCRQLGILWHFGIFAKKSNKKSNPIFPILSNFFLSFRLFRTFRLSDSTTLVWTTLHSVSSSQVLQEEKTLGTDRPAGLSCASFWCVASAPFQRRSCNHTGHKREGMQLPCQLEGSQLKGIAFS